MSSDLAPILHTCPNCSALLDVSEQEPFSEVHCPSCDVLTRVRTRFDHFEIQEAIASGGMGTVYRARDVNLNRIVALKLLRKEFSADQEYIEKLETEAKITASVRHPYVVEVFSFGCDHGIYYIAMELVDKGSLDDLMGLQGRIAEVQVLEIGMQVALGLRAAFMAGLIHRDVKPGNILFADAHTAKIVDFGLAMPLEQAKESGEQEIWGTPYYVAPEKLNHEPEDFRSDIYSLGGTLFHALAGRPPFEAENASLVALKHLKSQAVSLQAFAPDISSPTAYVINRTLAKDPEDRYQSYDELVEHLEYARTQLLENSSKPRQPKARVVLEGEQQQNFLGYILIGVIAFVLLLGIVMFIFRDNIMSRNESVDDLQRQQIEKRVNAAERKCADARKKVLAGNAREASAVFSEISQQQNLPVSVKNWAVVQKAISLYVGGQSAEGKLAVNELRDSRVLSIKADETKIINFFFDLGQLGASDGPISPQQFKNCKSDGNESAALLLLALTQWNHHRFSNAAMFFSEYVASEATGQWAWMADFKPITQPYLDDYKLYRQLAAQVSAADTREKKSALLPAINEAKAKLRTGGALPAELSSLYRDLETGKDHPLNQ
ncbi:MAG: protein kinase [Verrucomicrobiota bacterium]